MMKAEPGMYRYIIWDWNGTLLDDAWLCVETINSLLKENGLAEVTLDQYYEEFDFPVRDYYERLGFDFSRISFEKMAVDFINRYYSRFPNCQLHKDSLKVLQQFHRTGFSQTVLSATKQEQLENSVNHFELGSYFHRLVGLSNHYAHSKIDEGKELIDQLNIPRDTILYIGDTLHDYEVAEEMGVDCVLIAQGHHHPTKLARSGSKVYLSLEDFVEDFFSPV